MVFYPPETAPEVEFIPDDVAICDFMLDERHGRYALGYCMNPFTCGLTGKTYTALDVYERVDALARAMSKEFGWHPNQGSEWDKVVGIFSVNTIDFIPLTWAIHRLSGIASPANASYSVAELSHQLTNSGSKVLFTCMTLLPTALKAAEKAGIPKSKIYLLDLPEPLTNGQKPPKEFKTVDQLIKVGEKLPKLPRLDWSSGQGARQTAFLCYSSGTSGLPKGVKISHRNVIANTLQIEQAEHEYRQKLNPPRVISQYNDVALGLLPMSHIYSLVAVCHAGPFRGDQVIVLPKFDMKQYLAAIERFHIDSLYVVPPIIIAMLRNQEACNQHDLSSVRAVFTGAAPLGAETAADLQKQYPHWLIRQAYGLTETSTVVCLTYPEDVWLGSSGSLLPGYEARLVSPEGKEVTGYDEPGELVVRSPSVVLGYLKNEEATKETFEDGWMRTGDEAVVRLSPNGTEHIFIVDRIKELIKVKGMQVAPAELEAHLLSHPNVADCAVIPTPDDSAGEIAKAYVVKSGSASGDDEATARTIQKHVEDHKARHKWLKGGVEFIDAIPKSPSGKILRRLLRDKDRESRRQTGARL